MKYQRSLIKLTCLLATVTLAAAAFAVSPPPDGGYPNGNTAEGEDALFSLTTGVNNTALGYHALFSHTTGTGDTAVGYQALASNAGVASLNTAVGEFALSLNTYGSPNTAVGAEALQANTTGGFNVAIGTAASAANTTGGNNIAIGAYVLGSSTSNLNIAIGTNTMDSHGQGDGNVAVGHFAMFNNFVGSSNVAVGNNALIGNGGSNNVALGYSALSRSFGGASKNIAVGYQAGMAIEQGSNNIDIGDVGVATDKNTTRIGNVRTANTYIAGISGVTVAGGVGVIIDTTGHLGTVVSSERYKDAIKPMDKASEAILALNPVTFRYKHALDPDGIPQFGLVAEQVEKVNPDLVARDEQGKPYTVRYEAVNAMLLNEFLKEHRKVEEQEHKLAAQDTKAQEQDAAIARLESLVAQQQRQIGALSSKVQKVSDRIGAAKPSLRVAANNE